MTIAIAGLLLAPQALGADSLNIGQGTWELGGTGTVDMYFGDFGSEVTLTLAPAVGYFVADSLELRGGIDLRFGDGFSSWFFFAGVDYFFGATSIQPYVGGGLGFGEVDVFFFNDEQLLVFGRGGVIVPMNRKVGIDFGGRLEIISDNDIVVHVPLGYFGVRAFFP